MVQEQERGITITSAATTCILERPPHQHHRHARPRRLHRRGRALAARARRRRRRVRRRRRRRAPDRDGLAPGQQVRRAAHVLHQQDGPHRRRLLQARRLASRTASAPTSPSSSCRSAPRADFKGVIDLLEMKALVWHDEELGAKCDVVEIPADLRGPGRGVPPRADRRRCRTTTTTILEKYLGDEEITVDDLKRAHPQAPPSPTRSCPMLSGIGVQEQGRAAAARRRRRLPARRRSTSRRSRA